MNNIETEEIMKLGRLAYEAYNEEIPTWYIFSHGFPPEWEDLPTDEKRSWCTVVTKVIGTYYERVLQNPNYQEYIRYLKEKVNA